MRGLALASAAAVVLGATGAVLLHVARDRAGTPVTTLEVTERELALEPNPDQNSGVRLHWRWQNTASWSYDGAAMPLWFNREKLAEVGYDVHVDAEDAAAPAFYRARPSVAVWVALRAQPEPSVQGLAAFDVGRDAGRLRRLHADTPGLVIAGGVARLSLDRRRDPATREESGPLRLRGILIELRNAEITVPLPYSRVLEPLRAAPTERYLVNGAPPRYAVTLAWGEAAEPWVTGCRLLPAR